MQAGGFISANSGAAPPEANSIPIPKDNADAAFDAAVCIGCGACVAACKIPLQCSLFQQNFTVRLIAAR